MAPTRPSWDEYGLELAFTVSRRAACNRSRVGAVILDAQHRIVSCGYNGVPAGQVNCSDGGCPRGQLSYDELPALSDYSNCNGIHAERNAIDYAPADRCLGSTIYITRAPCEGCREHTLASGITRVVWPDGEESYA